MPINTIGDRLISALNSGGTQEQLEIIRRELNTIGFLSTVIAKWNTSGYASFKELRAETPIFDSMPNEGGTITLYGGTQTISSATWADCPVSFTGKSRFFVDSGDGTKIYVKAPGPRVVVITGTFGYDASAVGQRGIIAKAYDTAHPTGLGIASSNILLVPADASGASVYYPFSIVLYSSMYSIEWIKFFTYQNSGAPLNMIGCDGVIFVVK